MFEFAWWIIVGLIAGSLARLFIRGRQPIGCLFTLLLGLGGSLVGGYISSVIFGVDPTEAGPHKGGIIMSTIGAVIILAIYVRYQKKQQLP